jgi:hypothetical protein
MRQRNRVLVDRPVDFNYDYRMKCECGQSSLLTSVDYAEEINGAHMPCEHCGASIHFGRAVIAIRDTQDPALNDVTLPRLAWYHTSTWPDWPSPAYVEHTERELRKAVARFHLDPMYSTSDQARTALHLGTYEAALENMLRRMRNQADDSAQFYLFRVQLRPDLRINPGHRDETSEAASKLSISEMESDDLDVVRYLNAHEAEGTLSLGVTPNAIATVQQLPIPITDLVDTSDISRLDPLLDALADEQRDVEAATAKIAHLAPIDRRMIALGVRSDLSGLVLAAEKRETSLNELWHEIETVLKELYLSRVSPVVSREFEGSLNRWRAATDTATSADFIRRFRQMAALFTHPDQVIERLSAQPWRATTIG